MSSETLYEITPLSSEDCFYFVERYKTNFDFPLHKHSEYELNYIENGQGARRVVGDSIEEIGSYDLVLITGAELEHVWENHHIKEQKIREITLQFSGETLLSGLINKNQFKSIKLMMERAKKGLKFPLDTILHVKPLLYSLCKEEKGFYSVMNFFNLLYELSLCDNAVVLSSSAFASVEQGTNSRRIQRVNDYLNQHFAEKVTLKDVADIAGMSEVSFSRFFHTCTSKKFIDYLIDLRIGHAARMLVDTNQSISEISYACGFNNISNFNRVFKKRKKFTPTEFRDNFNKTKLIV